MKSEKVSVKLLYNDTDLISTELELFEEAPDNKDMVLLELTINGKKINCKSENFFNALLYLRKELEKMYTLIMCNGSAQNVYPSPMQLSMGTGRVAYKTYFGHQAKIADVVDIFDYDESLKFVSTEAQLDFHNRWLKSITG